MIKNKSELLRGGNTPKQRKARKDLCAILESALDAVDPFTLVGQALSLRGDTLRVAGDPSLKLSSYEHIYVVGAGKAVYAMALAVEKLLRHRITEGCITIPSLPLHNELRTIIACEARHPTPDLRGVIGAKRIKQTLEKARANDLIISVISGGGSALMPLPAEGITLKEKIALTSLLLKTPATINEINVVRKHLSQIKGGQFACLAYPATLVTLYISDIIDDPFDIQASGPTAPDPSTFHDAIAILKKYEIWNSASKGIRNRLTNGARGIIPETPKPEHEAFCEGKIYNVTIGNHRTAVRAAVSEGMKRGYHSLELTASIQGEAREVATMLVAIGKNIQRYGMPLKRPALIVAGGETTVTVRGKGQGGRNQELALAALPQLREGMAIVSFGTDGVDGITSVPVAGALADLGTRERALRKRCDIETFLKNNDSYSFFKTVGDHIHTGHTGTNVGDVLLVMIS